MSASPAAASRADPAGRPLPAIGRWFLAAGLALLLALVGVLDRRLSAPVPSARSVAVPVPPAVRAELPPTVRASAPTVAEGPPPVRLEDTVRAAGSVKSIIKRTQIVEPPAAPAPALVIKSARKRPPPVEHPTVPEPAPDVAVETNPVTLFVHETPPRAAEPVAAPRSETVAAAASRETVIVDTPAAEPAPPSRPRFELPVCKGFQLYRPTTPCRAPPRRG